MRNAITAILCATAVLTSCTRLIAREGEDVNPAAEPKLAVAAGLFRSRLESLKQYACPAWFRDAKFGIWAHWGPQAVPMDGDWYARGIYEQGSKHYKYHLQHYGHPSQFGYKDIIPIWKAEKWDPDRLMRLYKEAGAKYFVSMGSHHDDFFLWNSKLHRWNAVNMGPKRDVVDQWQQAAKKYGLRFGVSEHLAASFTWFQRPAWRHRFCLSKPIRGQQSAETLANRPDLFNRPLNGMVARRAQHFDSCDNHRLVGFRLDRQNYVSHVVAAAVENDLKVVRHRESLEARLVAGDEQLGPDQFGKRLGVLATIIAAPDQPEDVGPIDAVAAAKIAEQHRRVESLRIDAVGQAVRDQHPLRQPHGQWTTPQEASQRQTNLFGRRTVTLPQSDSERHVQQLVVLADREIGELRHLVVAEDQMHLPRMLHDQLGDVFEDRVRHAAAAGIARSAVADFLNHQMTVRVLVEGGDLADAVEVAAMPVYVAGDHHFIGQFRRQHHRAALPAGHLPVDLRGAIERGQDVRDVERRGDHHHVRPAVCHFRPANLLHITHSTL